MKFISTASLVALAATLATSAQAAPAARLDFGNFLDSFSSYLNQNHHNHPATKTVYVTLGYGETAPTPTTSWGMDTEKPAEFGSLGSDMNAPTDAEASDSSSESDDIATDGQETPSSTASSSASASEESSSSSSDGAGASDWVTQMVCRVNVVRSQNGAQPLGISSELNKLSQGQSDYQNSINQMTHSNPAGGLGDRLSAIGVSWASAAENVAAGMQTPEEAQDAWEKSSGHFENMVNPSMAYFGAARTNNYYTQEFYGVSGGARAQDIPQCN
ncbi:hypothetical protein EV177_005807 [Coemansia sp. RSA 1804]|nr:hypothetical protein EV177_005807 [Coemansia sp. RSA 1804]